MNYSEAFEEWTSIWEWEWDKMLGEWILNSKYYVFTTSDVCDQSSNESEIQEMTTDWQIFVKILEVIK